MTSYLKLDITPEARKDIRSILRHTGKTWGSQQRVIYSRYINEGLDELTRFPELGAAQADLPNGYRSRVIRQHVAYYRVDDELVTVIRILHGQMDAAAHL